MPWDSATLNLVASRVGSSLALAFLLLVSALAQPGRAEEGQEDLLARVIRAHTRIQNASIHALVDVVGEVEFKGQQESQLWLARPQQLAWRSQAKLPTETLEVQIVADGQDIWVYNSTEKNVYLKRPFHEDVLGLSTPEVGLGMGLHTLVLRLMSGNRDHVLNGKQLRIPNPEPNAQGECMLELVNGEDVDQLFVDGRTFLLKRMLALVGGKPMARAALTYKLVKPDAGVFKFVPPPGSSPAPQ
jgi:outer membrane lipoprotein-sorting protein